MSKKSFKKGKSSVTYSDTGFKQIKKLFKNRKIPKVKVGILGSGSDRDDNGELTNASIGAIHELGLGNPVRSFLRAPLINHYSKFLKKSGFFKNGEEIRESLENSSLKPLFEKMAVVAENVVDEAFQTGGFGEWKPSDMSKKKNNQTLVESQQLRDSITSEVNE